EDRGLFLELFGGDAARDTGDLDAVADAFLAQRIGMEGLVGQYRHVAQSFEMADRGMDVDRLDRIARNEADAVEMLRKLQKIAVIGMVAGAPAIVEIGAVGRAADGSEGHR